MPKNWWFKFEQRVWQSDPALSGCSLAARGFWLEIICVMHSQDNYSVSGTLEQIARMARCESSEVAKYALELKSATAADVALGHGNVTLVSRRLKRELTAREQSTLRKRKERGHTDVTTQSKSNKKEVKKEEKNGGQPPDAPEAEIWRAGKSLLSRSGLNENQSGSFLGSMVKSYSREAVGEAIATTLANNAADPKSYLVAVLQKRLGASDKAKARVGKHDESAPLTPTDHRCMLGHDYCLKDHRGEA